MSLSETAAFSPVRTTPARPTGHAAQVEDPRVTEAVLYSLPIALLAAVLAVKTWGVVALTMAALPMVPVMFAFFIYITLP